MDRIVLENLKCKDNINIDEYIKYREIAQKEMEYPDWLGDFTREDIEFMLNNGCKIWMYYNNDDDFVCSIMMIPASERAMFKFNLDYNHHDVIDYGSMFVMPKYRGSGLQYQMLCQLDKYCIDLGYKYAIGTVHPDNVYSINNFIKDGFELIDTKSFTRGIRNIYLKKYDK